jgi:flavin-dependent dehydrogenase
VTYPGRARAITRTVLDDALRAAALDAGAIAFAGRAGRPLGSGGDIDGFTVSDGDGEELRADFVIGADGATSHVAQSAGLVEGSRVLWGFEVRWYMDQHVDLPAITL